ncbi:MAG: hypothetical protein ACRC7S_17470 [Cetobacterium sp.]
MKVIMSVEVEIDVNETELSEELCVNLREQFYIALEQTKFNATVNDVWED